MDNRFGVISLLLRKSMLNEQAFSLAVGEGLIKISEDGTLRWMLDSTVLLAYFCGRMWSGDCGRYSRRKECWLWQFGKEPFPAAALGRLFGVKAIKESRKKRKNLSLPRGFKVVDSLFDAMDGGNL